MRNLFLTFAVLLAATPAALAQGRNLTLLGIPSATVAPAGLAYIALSGTPENPVNDRTDGSLELGFGLGTAEETVGVQGKVVITSLTDSFGDSGYLGLKFSRRVATAPVPMYFALDIDDLAGWGESSQNNVAVNATLTGFTSATLGGQRLPVMFTVGAGNRVRNGATDPGVFAGVGAGFTEHLGGSVAWTGETIDLGLSLRPMPEQPIVINLTLGDAPDLLGSRRVSISAAWVFRKGQGG